MTTASGTPRARTGRPAARPDRSPPDVSVLLVSWNTRDKTRSCLESLPAAVTDGLRYEVMAVDNGSTDGSAEMLAGYPGVRLIRNDRNLGYAQAVNQAYREARADLLLLLNSDVRCRPGTVSTMVSFLRQRPEAAGVGPQYLDENGAVEPHYLGLLGFRAALGLAAGLRWLPGLRGAWRAYQLDGEDFRQARPVPQPAASCLLLRRADLDPDRVFDEDYPLYFNDVWLARRLAAAGRQLWMTPDAVVIHNRGSSTRLLDAATRSRHHLGGLLRYVAQTQPRHRLLLLRAMTLIDRQLRWVLGVRGQLGLRDLVAALRGDPGPLPGGDLQDWVVMLSGVDWRTEAHRQHALARELLADHRVLFVEPPGRRPRWRFTVCRIAPSLWRVVPPTVLPAGRQLPPVNWLNRRIGALLVRRWLDRRPGRRLIWIDEDLSATTARHLGGEAVIYDGADLDWTFTRRWSRWYLRRGMRRAVGAADLVLASSPALVQRLPDARRPPVPLPNGCDPDQFSPSGPVAEWADQLPRPVLGYVGAVDTRAFDAELVAAVARLRPDWTFLIVGPSTPAGRAPLARLANVRLREPVEFAQVPAILRACDVCLIPYRVGGLIDYVQPKKCYEYLALGKPVVATPLPALERLDGLIQLAAGPTAFVRAVEQALRSSRCPDASARRRAAALRNSWSVRGNQLRNLIAELAAGR
ncbi:glycosyltransferase [Plantactinospora solaniradicis]|uniref:Glycosyltransferase n=1 Tax=Plantactinospora solaniradicis TaxID=1723736 RepID=A0ABW1K8N3_9ACTN